MLLSQTQSRCAACCGSTTCASESKPADASSETLRPSTHHSSHTNRSATSRPVWPIRGSLTDAGPRDRFHRLSRQSIRPMTLLAAGSIRPRVSRGRGPASRLPCSLFHERVRLAHQRGAHVSLFPALCNTSSPSASNARQIHAAGDVVFDSLPLVICPFVADPVAAGN